MNITPFDLFRVYAHLDAEGGSERLAEAVIGDFLKRFPGPDSGGGFLIGAFPMEGSWPVSEMHPAGDEFVYCLSGDMDFVLESDGQPERVVPLRAGEAVLIPRGVWHRAVVRVSGATLHVTPVAGNQHRPAAVEI